MADFINFEADIEGDDEEIVEEDDEVSNISDVDSGNSFIDNQEVKTDVSFYRHFANVENDIDQVLKDALEDIDKFDEISNLCEGSEEEAEIDHFKNVEVDIKKFNESLFPRVDVDQFCNAILYALRFDKTGLKDMCNKGEFEKTIDKSIVEELNNPEKFQFIIELQKFHMCYEINAIVSKHNYFLRVFELKNKFRQFTMKDKSKQKILRQLSSCLIEKYSGFTVISIEFKKKQRKMFEPIDIIINQQNVLKQNHFTIFLMIFQKHIHLYIQKEKKGMSRAHKCYQCYYCNKFFIPETRGKRHMENCSGRPGVVYDFNNQNLISYQDNFHAKGDVPFVIYFDFETTARTDNCLDPEQKKMFFVSYVMIVAFHPELKLDRIIIQRSFTHSIEQLTT